MNFISEFHYENTHKEPMYGDRLYLFNRVRQFHYSQKPASPEEREEKIQSD